MRAFIRQKFSSRSHSEIRNIQNLYRLYRGGQFTLPAAESYQYGFKLAARSGNRTIYPIDTWGPSIWDDKSPSGKRIDTYLKAHFYDVNDPEATAVNARGDYLERHGTYLDELRYLNTESAVQGNASWYSIFDGWDGKPTTREVRTWRNGTLATATFFQTFLASFVLEIV